MQTLTFGKQERLCSQKLIDELFTEGKSFFIYPFKVVWHSFPDEENSFQVTFTVPKRIFKHAVDRNKIKRRSKEAYRLNKLLLYENNHISKKKCIFMLIYTDKKILEYKVIEHKIKQILLRLANEYASTDH